MIANNQFKHKRLFLLLLIFSMLLIISACSSESDDETNNNDEEIVNNADDEFKDNDNIIKDQLIRNSVFSVPPNSTFVMNVDGGHLYESTDDVEKIVDYYADYPQLSLNFSFKEQQYYMYQTRLMEYMLTTPSNRNESNFEKRMNDWVDGLSKILDEDGYIAGFIIYGIDENPDETIIVEITENLHRLSKEAKTAIFVPFANIQY